MGRIRCARLRACRCTTISWPSLAADMAAPSPTPGRFSRLLPFALALSLFCVVLGAKFNLLQRDGSDLPFWDQWDAEGDFLFRPHLERGLHAADLFRPHNEHRPV